MAAEFRVGAELSNWFNPGAPYSDLRVENITDGYFEISYLDGTDPTRIHMVFSWANINRFTVA